jgi:hypothetical protein
MSRSIGEYIHDGLLEARSNISALLALKRACAKLEYCLGHRCLQP